MHGVPGDLSASGGEFLDGFHERLRRGANGAVLHVDDQQRRALAETGAAAETGGAVGFLFVLWNDGVPWPHEAILRSVPIPCLEGVIAILGDGALALFERGKMLAH